MAHRRLTGTGNADCKAGDCPNVYATDRGSLVIQGDVYSDLDVPTGEAAVEIPHSVLREAIRALGW